MSETSKVRGRPPRGPKSGKGHTLTTRITAETREALEAEANRTGRSISQVAEIWIEEGRKGSEGRTEALGGRYLAPMIQAFVLKATALQQREGKSIHESPTVVANVELALEEMISLPLYEAMQRQARLRAEEEGLPKDQRDKRAEELCVAWAMAAYDDRQRTQALANALRSHRAVEAKK